MYAITGTIENLDLAVIFQTMNISKKTGCMEIKTGNDISRVFFDQGTIIHAETEKLVGESAFYDMLTISNGSWGFVPEMTTKKRSINNKIEGLLLNWSNLIDEWNSINSRLPPNDSILKMAEISEDERENLKFNIEEWGVLDLIKKYGQISKVFSESGIGKFKTSKVLLKFLSSNLVMIIRQDKEKIEKIIKFLNDINIELGGHCLGVNHYRHVMDKLKIELTKKHNSLCNLTLDEKLNFKGFVTKELNTEELVDACKELLWKVVDYVSTLVGSQVVYSRMSKIISNHFKQGDDLMKILKLDEYVRSEGKI